MDSVIYPIFEQPGPDGSTRLTVLSTGYRYPRFGEPGQGQDPGSRSATKSPEALSNSTLGNLPKTVSY